MIQREYLSFLPDFETHLNYISFLSDTSNGLSIKYNKSFVNTIPESVFVSKKLNLINLTKRSLDGEYSTILANKEYASMCVSWISVKSYYLLFNMYMLVLYLILGNDSPFNSNHYKLWVDIKKLLKCNDLCFNNNLFNEIHLLKDAISFSIPSGENIKTSSSFRPKQIFKKLCLYHLEDYKRRKNIKSFRSTADKSLREGFLNGTDVNICEFFYWYRIKANYRDLEFLSSNIPDERFADFYCKYYNLTMNVFNASKDLINTLSSSRLSKPLF